MTQENTQQTQPVSRLTRTLRYRQLHAMRCSGRISQLVVQPSLGLMPGLSASWIHYIADFAYRDHETGEQVFEELGRGNHWARRIQRRLLRWVHGITIRQA